jgi:hypothetical protein
MINIDYQSIYHTKVLAANRIAKPRKYVTKLNMRVNMTSSYWQVPLAEGIKNVSPRSKVDIIPRIIYMGIY